MPRFSVPERAAVVVLLLVCAAALAPAQGPAPAPPEAKQPAPQAPDAKSDDPVVLSVGDEKLTKSEVERIISGMSPQNRSYFEAQGRALLPQYLVRIKILSNEAKKHHIDEQPEVKRAIALAADSVLADAERKRLETTIPVAEEEVKQAYERRKAEFEQVHIRRLLVRTENSLLGQTSAPKRPPLTAADAKAKAEDLRKQILGGASFEELAKANSDDPETSPRGGDMGFVNFQDVIPPIAQAAYDLEPGRVSNVITTPFGFELIQVVEKRIRPLEEVRPMLEASLRQAGVEYRLQELQDQYKIFVDTKYFSAEPQASGAQAPAKP